MAADGGRYDSVRVQLDHPDLIRFFDYWRSKVTRRRLPSRADFDPVDIPDLLPWIYLVDVLDADGRRRLRCRLIGTSIVARTGRDMTGHYFDDGMFSEKTLAAVTEAFDRVIDGRAPEVFSSRPDLLLNDKLKYTPYTRVLCPLATNGKTVDMLAGMMAFEE